MRRAAIDKAVLVEQGALGVTGSRIDHQAPNLTIVRIGSRRLFIPDLTLVQLLKTVQHELELWVGLGQRRQRLTRIAEPSGSGHPPRHRCVRRCPPSLGVAGDRFVSLPFDRLKERQLGAAAGIA